MKKQYGYFIIVLAVTFVLLNFFSFSKVDEESDNQFSQKFNKNYNVYALSMQDSLSFCGETVPLNCFDVKESLDREMHVNTYWQSQTLLFLKRTNRYFSTIEKVLIEEGIPEDFKYLALIESGLMNVVSPSGAAGFWQFLEGTAKDYKLEVNEEIDERYHLEKSTKAACAYFKDAYLKYGNWTLVAASYNMGMTGLEKQLKRQKVNNYYDLLLNIETARYVYRILALKTIIQNPNTFGFNIRQVDLYREIQYKEVIVDSAVTNFADFAHTQGVNYKMLKYLNPWLRQSYLTNRSNKVYKLKIIKSGIRTIPATTVGVLKVDTVKE